MFETDNNLKGDQPFNIEVSHPRPDYNTNNIGDNYFNRIFLNITRQRGNADMEQHFIFLEEVLNQYLTNPDNAEYEHILSLRKLLVNYLEQCDRSLKTINSIQKDSKCSKQKQQHKIRERSKITNAIRYKILKRDEFHCVLCGAIGKTTELVIDHIVPLSKGGTSDMNNLRTLCYECNVGKGDQGEY